MMNWFKKKCKIRFFSVVPGIEMVHPIIPARQYKFKWFAEALKKFKQQDSQTEGPWLVNGINRCPGVIDMLGQGFIITAPFDFAITTNSTNNSIFQWQAPDNGIGQEYISGHNPEQFAEFAPFREDTLRTIIKINTFWRYSGTVKFLQLPIPYPDHNIFSAVPGVVNPDNYYALNIQLYWHKLDGTYLVKAGTPLCQFVPIPDDLDITLTVDQATAEDLYIDRSYFYLINHTYKKNIAVWKQAGKKILDKLKQNNKEKQ
jgi:hypothetical protein